MRLSYLSSRCPACSFKLIRWGKTTKGRQRYRCSNCGKSKLRKSPGLLSRKKMFVLFREYVLYGATYDRLSYRSGFSIQYLSLWFHKFLEEPTPPIPKFDQLQEDAFLLADGLWFGRYFVLMVYRQSKNLLILKISTAKREVSTKIAKDFKILLSLGYHFTGIISDDGTGLVKAVKEIFPHVPHQVCLAHMHRRVVANIGKKPTDERVEKLRFSRLGLEN